MAINDREIGSEAQSTVVSWLKALEAGEVVNLKVSRMNTVATEESKNLVESSYEIQIGKNGLGLHLKSTKNSQHGLFIESIVKNGAAEQVNLEIVKVRGGVVDNHAKVKLHLVSNEASYFC